MERVLLGIFEQYDIYHHDRLADEIPVFAIFEANPEQILEDLGKMTDDMERLIIELKEVD